jgi:hypothetical protein
MQVFRGVNAPVAMENVLWVDTGRDSPVLRIRAAHDGFVEMTVSPGDLQKLTELLERETGSIEGQAMVLNIEVDEAVEEVFGEPGRRSARARQAMIDERKNETR